MFVAVPAIRAKSGRESLKETEMAQQAEEAAQGADIFAPISPFITLEKKNGRKEKKRQKGERVEGFPKREQITLEETIASGKVVSVVSQETVKAHPTLTENISYQGIDEKGEGAYQQSDGIKKTGQVHAEEGREEKCPQQIILEITPEPRQWPGFPYFAGYEIKDRP